MSISNVDIAIRRTEMNNLLVFQERFRSLRGKMSQAEFAERICVSRPTVGFYENGERLPDALTLKKIAECCNVSIDWMLGLSNGGKDRLIEDLTSQISVLKDKMAQINTIIGR